VPRHLFEILSPQAALARSEALGAVDETYMRRALDLAWRAAGRTAPNPMVGAVVVCDGAIVGEGYHARCGDAHGEVVALDAAGESARGATLYVTLEPCSHHGRTPPCVDRILESGVARVVVTTIDPDRRVDGRGVDVLRGAGVRVEVGCLPAAAAAQNLGYYKNRLGLEPTVTLKIAATLDGKIARAPGRRDDVTGVEARRYVHALRAAHDCVVVGVDTMLVDAPALDLRLLERAGELRPPTPVVLDTHLRTPADNRWSAEGRPYVVVAGRTAGDDRARAIESGGGRVVRCESGDGGVSIDGVLRALSGLGFGSVLVEGGAGVFTSFLRSGRWDAFYLFQSSRLFGDAGVPMFRGEGGDEIDGHLVDSTDVGGDILHRFLSTRAWDDVMPRVAARE
jgi:diaminohydroxyphosphoribosylaminopyrimidine deaminase/5-amino-6-(5-phosphoribosylamino)uracil reductase